MLWSLYSRAGTGRIKESFNIIFLTIVDHYYKLTALIEYLTSHYSLTTTILESISDVLFCMAPQLLSVSICMSD